MFVSRLLRVAWVPVVVLLDALPAALIAAVVEESVVAFHNGYAEAGLLWLPLFAVADRVRSVLPTAIAVSAFVHLGLFGLNVLRPLGYVARAAALAFGALVLVCAALWRNQVLDFALPLLPSSAADLLATLRMGWALQHRLFWTFVGGTVLAAIALRFFVSALLKSPRPTFLLPLAAAALTTVVVSGAEVARHVRLDADSKPNVLLVVLDTVSASHLSMYGYGRDTAPELSAAAARGAVFSNAYSVAPWTLPSHATLFTGLLPVAHGATQEHLKLDDRHFTLAEILRNDGYQTMAAVGNSIVGRHTGLEQGFGTFLPTWRKDVDAVYGAGPQHVNNAALLHFLDGLDDDDRFFVFLNYIEAHSPYEPPEEFLRRVVADADLRRAARSIDQSWQAYYAGTNPLSEEDFARLSDLYDAEIVQLDEIFGDLLDELRNRGLLDETLVVVTSDHGENLGDHGHFDHVFSIHDSLLRVPLILLGNGVEAGRTEARPVDSADLYATIAAAAAPDARPAGTGGRDLRRPLTAAAGPVAEYYFPNQALSTFDAEDLARGGERLAGFSRRLRAIREGGWKLIWSSDGAHELYDTVLDPQERTNLAVDSPEIVVRLAAKLEALLAQAAARPFSFATEPEPVRSGFEGLDEEAKERLRSLGYLR